MRVATLQNPKGGWCVLSLDQPDWLAERCGQASPDAQVKAANISQLYTRLIKQWSPLVTGLVLEAEFGLPLISQKAKKVGVALKLESNQASDPFSPPFLQTDWGVEEIAANYGVVKVGLWYHPSEAQALPKKQMLAELADYAAYVKADLWLDVSLLELPAGTAKADSSRAEALIETVQELRDFCQLMVVNSVPDALTAATLTAELDQPWLVRLDQPDYAQAKEALREALEAGAQGCVVGNCIWAGLPLTPSPSQLDVFIQSEARDRLIELKRIVDEQVGQAAQSHQPGSTSLG